ncbi:MAG: sulfatase-like hydrolase/transferase [Candidatus Saliniplasma sp.]
MEKRNILLITVDSLRRDSIRNMPTLNSFAKDHSHFTRAYTNGPSTPFSFPSLFNRNYDPIEDPIKIREPTLTEDLNNHGYETLGLVASNPYISALSGYQRGFETFEDFITSEGREVRREMWNVFQRFPNVFQNLRDVYRWYFKEDITSSLSGKVISQKSKEWLSEFKSKKRPFFFWIHFMDTHYPYTPPLEQTDFSISRITSLNNFRKKRNIEDTEDSKKRIEELKELYADASRWLDEQMLILFNFLKAIDLWGRTDIVVTSDHGEGFGEHGFLGHPSQLYEEVVNIPLIAKIKEVSGGQERIVEMRDIPATFSLTPTRFGRSLKERKDEDRTVPLRARHAGGRSCMKKGMNLISRPESLKYGIYGFVTEQYKFIYDEEGQKIELYDITEDPDETSDISSEKEDLVEYFKFKLSRD